MASSCHATYQYLKIVFMRGPMSSRRVTTSTAATIAQPPATTRRAGGEATGVRATASSTRATASPTVISVTARSGATSVPPPTTSTPPASSMRSTPVRTPAATATALTAANRPNCWRKLDSDVCSVAPTSPTSITSLRHAYGANRRSTTAPTAAAAPATSRHGARWRHAAPNANTTMSASGTASHVFVIRAKPMDAPSRPASTRAGVRAPSTSAPCAATDSASVAMTMAMPMTCGWASP